MEKVKINIKIRQNFWKNKRLFKKKNDWKNNIKT